MSNSNEQTLFGHPKGAFLLAGTELWERFGFFGMMGLLVLFLTSSPMEAGFGWQPGSAKSLVGNFFAAMWILPVVGSWLADRYIGAYRSIVLGALMMMLGYFMFSLPAIMPQIVGSVTGIPVLETIQHSGVELGQVWLKADVVQALVQQSDSDKTANIVIFAYRLMGISFYLGLILVAIGNAFFKPCIVAGVGQFYKEGDSRRESGYTILYLCINFGGLLSNFVVGTLGERIGWHYGFSAASIGMLIGVFVILFNRRALAKTIGTRQVSSRYESGKSRTSFTDKDRQNFKAILLLMVFTALYLATYGQLVGLVNEFVFQRINRILFGFEIPATWFLSLNPLFIILFGAFLAGLWQRLEINGKNPPVLIKYLAGMTLISLSFLCLAGAALQGGGSPDGKGHMLWIIIAYLLFTLGELFIFPIFMALITRLGPPGYSNMAAGLFFFAAGIGSYASGQIGRLSDHYGDLAVFSGTAIGAFAAGIIATTLVRRFNSWINE